MASGWSCNGNWVDVRQLLAGLLTICMFLMLAHLITSPMHAPHPHPTANIIPDRNRNRNRNGSLSPCWPNASSSINPNSSGFITFSLSPTPAHHIAQVADAVVIAAYLRATLLLPDIRRNQLGHSRNFEHIYDLHNFMSTLTGIIQVTKHLPDHMLTRRPAVLRIKNRVSPYIIQTQILPAFRRNNYLRLALVYPSTALHPNQLYTDKHLLATSCVAMFHSLLLQPGLRQVGDNMIQRLRELAANSNGEFVAIDWNLDALGKTSTCMLDAVAQRKQCYNVTEVVSLLQKVGFGEETVVYSTEDAGWHESLKTLKNSFPKTYTKDEILPAEEKGHFLKAGNEDLKKALDLHVCSKSDTFVAAVYGPFYSHVSGRRIASGLTHILSPLQSVSENSDFLSPFVSKKSHMAYSCYC